MRLPTQCSRATSSCRPHPRPAAQSSQARVLSPAHSTSPSSLRPTSFYHWPSLGGAEKHSPPPRKRSAALLSKIQQYLWHCNHLPNLMNPVGWDISGPDNIFTFQCLIFITFVVHMPIHAARLQIVCVCVCVVLYMDSPVTMTLGINIILSPSF